MAPQQGETGSETGPRRCRRRYGAAAEARSRYSRCSQRFSASNCQFQCRFLRSSPLAAAAVIIIRPRAVLLQAAACRLSRAFMRRLQPRAATLTWPRVHATAGRQAGLAGLVESVQVNVRIRARTGNEGLSVYHTFLPRHRLLSYRLDLYIKSGSAPEGLFSPCPARPLPKAGSAVSRSTD